MDHADVVNVIVGHVIGEVGRRSRRRGVGVAQSHAASAQIPHVASDNLVILAALADIDRVTAKTREAASENGTLSGEAGLQRGLDLHRGLGVHVMAAGETPICPGKNQAVKYNVMHWAILLSL